VIAILFGHDGAGAALAGPDACARLRLQRLSDALTAACLLTARPGPARQGGRREFLARSVRCAFAGLAAFGGYAIVVWAMTQATIGAVAACANARSYSPRSAASPFLGEPFRGARAGAALLILGGVIALRFA